MDYKLHLLKRTFNHRLALFTMLALAAVGAGEAVAAPSQDRSIGPHKKLIQIGQDAPDTAYYRAHIREMEKAGFDGIAIVPTVKIGGKTASMMWGPWFSTSHKWEYVNFQHVVEDMRAAKSRRFTDNFLLVTRHVISLTYSDGTVEPLKQTDWFADDFQTIVDNLALAARIAKEAGFKGIALDLEQYGGGAYGTWRFPFNYGQTAAQFPEMKHSFDKCQAQVRLRAKQIMEAVSKQYPDITMMVLPSAYEVAETTAGFAKAYNPKLEGLAASDYSLYPAFIDGLLEGAGPKVRFFDAYEDSYGWTFEKQFQESRHEFEAAGRKFSAVPKLFEKRMGLSFGVWIDHRGWNQQAPFYANHFTPDEFAYSLHSALKQSDSYAWIWCEQAVFWPNSGMRNGPATVPAEYIAALNNYRKPQPLNYKRDSRGAAADPSPAPASSQPGYSDAETFGPLRGEYEYIADLPKKWSFLADDLDIGIGRYSNVSWDASKWPLVEIGDYYENRGYKFNGMAWYRTSFDIPKSLEGKPVFLQFGGIAGSAVHVYVNSGWLAPEKAAANGVMTWNITPKALYGQKNTVVVQIHNPAGPGGIYKSVRLVTTAQSVAQQ